MPKIYGAKEVPNIRMIFFKNGSQIKVIDSDSIYNYEEHLEDANEDNEVEIIDALIAPTTYDFIVENQYDEIWLLRSHLLRSVDTCKDELYFPPILKFHHLSIEHTLEAGGDPARWRYKLWN